MSHARPARRRLAVAVTAALAVTAGLTGTIAPAQAAPPAPGSATARQAAAESVAAFPVGQEFTSVTASGYVVRDLATGTRSWVRASDGAVTELGKDPVRATGHGDLLAVIGDHTVEVRDLATGRTVLSVPTEPTDGVDYAGAAGQAVFTTNRDAPAGSELWMHTTDGATVPVTGLPDGARNYIVTNSTSTNALVKYVTGASDRHLGLMDVTTGTVTEPDLWDVTAENGDVALSATHVAWVERDDTHTSVVVRDRGTGETQRVSVGDASPSDFEIGLQGDYLTYSKKGGLTAETTDPLNALTAYSLKDGTTAKLLDHLISADTSPFGTLYVRGGTVAKGEGIYRVAPGPDGTAPTATLVASTGEPTELALGRYTILPVIDLSYGTSASMVWNLSRGNAEMKVTLRHVRTGKTAEFTLGPRRSRRYSIAWMGDLDRGSLSAYNGDYTWEVSARPINGIGPVLTRTGTFTVVRKRTVPHDFNDNGSPDLLARDSSGHLWREDSHFSDGVLNHTSTGSALVGGGWNIYDRIEAAANLGGATTCDLVARDKNGVLWLYLGKTDGTFDTRTRIGGGWGVYDKIAAGSDLTNDGKPDLLATDKSGVLWLYKGTGNWRAPFAGRTWVGEGWEIYNQLTAIGGATGGDLVARDKAGVLWHYRGLGDGTFDTRTRIGGGWNAYQETVGIGDANQDGQSDLFAYGSDGTSYFYAGTGDWHVPFAPRKVSTLFPAQKNVTSVS
ncbi:VCBS repeat-containing protein [Streptomyces sp. AC627_RSS907]|uniref:FG-GAP repeat domain-containing protein n=1 Tax=Streptomyces sp. AC627_RSS907 TaxID=2823684 RepID=UPI001C22FAFF|nr:VCBS repeat-containing protein [Streptomyces sp. AC627_RSS907]